jgi:hypothetical protein
MSRLAALLALLITVGPGLRAEEVVVDFEKAEIGKPVREWTEQGVVFKLAAPLARSKAAGRVMFFPHIGTDHKGILNAMATEQAIPVQATFPKSVAAVTLVMWGSTGCPVRLEALDDNGVVVDTASVAAAPGRKSPGQPVPFFRLSVAAPAISAIRFSGPRDGEFLAVDEIRFTPVEPHHPPSVATNSSN